MNVSDLPSGTAPPPVPFPHFPDRLHAFVWRNWTLVPLERLARVLAAEPEAVRALGRAMGLPDPPAVTEDQWRRSPITLIKRNWHLLPYEQLLQLLDWTPEELDYVLREDDFLYIKLGRLKPHCAPLRYAPPEAPARARAGEIARTVRQEFGEGAGLSEEPLFAFVSQLSGPAVGTERGGAGARERGGGKEAFSPRFCYSYFALYGDPLLDADADPYPDGYLARLAAAGVDGVWLQGVLYKLAPFPWDMQLSLRHEERLANLRALIERANRHGIGIYLYLNEPRSMPLTFFEAHPDVKGVTEHEFAALCTSSPEVQQYLTASVASLCRAAPELAGLFTITASENFTHCWSHHRGAECPRCGPRGAAAVIAEVNSLVREGIRQSGSKTGLFAWDWGWPDDEAEAIIRGLPQDVALMSVSEWNLPIKRGGVESIVGEYSISAVGPGPRARKHWAIARERALKCIAKIQASCTWELSAVPYIPAVANVARHIANLREAGVDGLMLGWTLGGYPSPNLEVVSEMSGDASLNPEEAMERVARRRFGEELAAPVVRAWNEMSAAFSEFPYHIGTVYQAPLQAGPSNLLWERPTGYRATMVGFPYDDLNSWRQVYPANVFISQLAKVADGFLRAVRTLRDASRRNPEVSPSDETRALAAEVGVAIAATLHFRSVASQSRFIQARDALAAARSAEEARPLCAALHEVLDGEIADARSVYALQVADSRIGFEASNQYYYVPLDLVEKVLNCRDLLDRWLPEQRAKWGL
jgi:hypothetical protein